MLPSSDLQLSAPFYVKRLTDQIFRSAVTRVPWAHVEGSGGSGSPEDPLLGTPGDSGSPLGEGEGAERTMRRRAHGPHRCNPNCRGILGVPARAAATAWTWQEGPPNTGCREQNKDRPCPRPQNLWSCHMAWTQGLGRCDELRISRPGDCPGCLVGPHVSQGPHGHRGQRQGAWLLPEPPEGTHPAHTLVLDFRAPELGVTRTVSVWSPSHCVWSFVTAAAGR